MAEQAVDDFLSAIAKAGDLWHSVDVRILAARIERDWHNIVTRCYLDATVPEKVPRFPKLPVTDLLGCWQHVLPFSSLEDVLRFAAAGELILAKTPVKYWSIMSTSGKDPYNFDTSFSDLSDAYSHAYEYWSCHQLSGMGNSVFDVSRRAGGRAALDNSARTSSVPHDGISGLAQLVIGSPNELELNRACLFEAFAPLEALIVAEDCRLHKGHLEYALVAGSEVAARTSGLGIAAVGSAPVPLSTRVELSRQSWKPEAGGDLRLEGDFDLTGYEVATLFLSVGPYAVHRIGLVDGAATSTNERVASYRVFDPDLTNLRESLRGEGSTGSARFDPSVGRLMNLLGFHVTQLSGDKRLEEAVDIIAHAASSGVCLAIECTTGALSSGGKIGKLVARLDLVRRALPDQQVKGVLITSIERSSLAQADLEAAAADELVVLCGEDLDDLFGMAVQSAALSDVLGYLWTRIPPKPKVLGAPGARRWP